MDETVAKPDLQKIVDEVFQIELEAITKVKPRLNGDFFKLVDYISNFSGRVVVSGVGKSGLIGQKISATLSSTGTSSFFIHPTEAFHGDLGALKNEDVLFLISNSGETEELVRLIPFAIEHDIKTVAFCGKVDSTLGKNCNFLIPVLIDKEACPLRLAPTSSTTACLVLGDALAVALMELSGFKKEDFARYHPGGNLGKQLLQTAKDIMIDRKNIPTVFDNSSIIEVIDKITNGRVGIAVVVDKSDTVRGVVSAGDLMRALNSEPVIDKIKMSDIITRSPVQMKDDTKVALLHEAMLKHEISTIIITNSSEKLVGVVHYNSVM